MPPLIITLLFLKILKALPFCNAFKINYLCVAELQMGDEFW